MLPPPTDVPAGWYRDPSGLPVWRYYDGRRWTEHTVGMVAPPRAVEPVRVLPLVVAVGAAGVLLVSLLAARLLLDALVGQGWPIAVYAAISVVIGYGPSLWWCRFASRRWGTGSAATDLGLKWSVTDLGWGPVVWLACIGCQLAAVLVVELFDIPLVSNVEDISELDLDRTYVISLLVTAVVAAPFVEEMVFRGLMLRGLLSRLPVVVAVGVQAAVFGLAHVDPVRGTGNIGLALVLAAVGVALGGSAYLFRRIGPAIIAHAILNAVVLAVVLLDPDLS